VQVLESGLYEWKDGQLSMISGSDIFIDKRINAILPFTDSSRMLICTAENGFFQYSEDQIDRWMSNHDQHFINDQINRGIKIDNNHFAIGTLLGGVYIMNESGEVLSQIDRNSGLDNNTILSLFQDKKGNLWVGLDNGVDLIKINSPLYYNSDISGELGSVYAAAIYEGDLYLGTNRGVFYTKFQQQPLVGEKKFNFIPGSQEQVWSLAVIDDKLFCGHNTATFVIEDHQLRTISNIGGGYVTKEYPYNDQYIVQGFYNGLSIFKKTNGNWKFSHTLPGFSRLSKHIEFERENVLWVSHTHKGLYRLELNDDLTEITEIRSFAEDSKSYLNKINKRVVFSSDSGFVYYDDIQNSFFSMAEINETLGDYAINSHVIPEGNDYYWIFKDGDCVRVKMDENYVGGIDDHVLNDLSEFLIPGNEDLYVVDSTYSIIYLDNGYAIYNNQWEDSHPDYEAKVFVSAFSFQNLKGEKHQGSDFLDIPYRFNNISIELSFPEFARDEVLLYNLLGYDSRWIETDGVQEINFQNLPFGDYVFNVKPEGKQDEQAVSVNFSIKPPWYKSRTAQALYLFAFLSFALLLVVLNRRKIKKINQKHELERTRILEKEAAENERKLIKLRNENLRNEIKLRNSRLAKSTFSLIHKNNTLRSVKEELTKIKDELGVRFPTKHYRRLVRNIDRDLTSEKDWRLFEQSFSEVHEQFLHRIKDEHPELTPADIQLCAYLKMNLSSKEMASLLNITVRGVEIRRYRLRKKLGLEHDTNLTDYIMTY